MCRFSAHSLRGRPAVSPSASQLNRRPKMVPADLSLSLLLSPSFCSPPPSSSEVEDVSDTIRWVEAESADPFTLSRIKCLALLFIFLGVSDKTFDADVGPAPSLYPSSPSSGSNGRVCTCSAIYDDHRLKIPYLATPIAPPIKMATGGLILNHAPPTYAVPVMATSQGSVPNGLPLCTAAVR